MSAATIVLRGKVLGPTDEEDAAREEWTHGPHFIENLTERVEVPADAAVYVSDEGAVTIRSAYTPLGGWTVKTTYPAWRVLAVEEVSS